MRGALNEFRSCFDVHFYHLKVKIIPKKRRIEGVSNIHFLATDSTKAIQVDLFKNMKISRIEWKSQELEFDRKHNAVMVHFPKTLQKDSLYQIAVHYQGSSVTGIGSFRDHGFHWERDGNNRKWIGLMAEHLGASHWYPCKNHLSDEPDSAYLQWEVPKKFDCFSNGKLQSVEEMEGGYLRHNYFVSNPIDNYNIAFYLGNYKTKELEYTSPIDSATHIVKFHTLDYETEKDIDYTFSNVEDMLYFYEIAFGAIRIGTMD